jgi:hypothetical protein
LFPAVSAFSELATTMADLCGEVAELLHQLALTSYATVGATLLAEMAVSFLGPFGFAQALAAASIMWAGLVAIINELITNMVKINDTMYRHALPSATLMRVPSP